MAIKQEMTVANPAINIQAAMIKVVGGSPLIVL